ncbi:MAG: NAD(P)-dependent alcohol dehydrogenase [Firmicutes bacterium]|nr:NAD(P)-dependent alcohol dehydrogenase [Bacillota bacterium]
MLCKAAVVHSKDAKYVIENIEVAPPKANEVLIKMAASGLCHTDELGREQVIPVPLPVVLGHEGSGVVAEVGAAVKTINPGDHVVISFPSCGHCSTCLEGKTHLCEDVFPLCFGGSMSDGTQRISLNGQGLSNFFGQSSFAEYAVSEERNVVVVDKDVDIALLGPLGCGFQTGAGTVLNGLQAKPGTSIVVFGCGAVGSAAVMGAKIAGCSQIIAVDIVPAKLALCEQLGATHTINGEETDDVIGQIKKITSGGACYSIETTGIGEIVKQAIRSLKPLGHCAIVGVSGEINIHVFEDIMMPARRLEGFIQGNSIPKLFIPQLIRYFKEGRFPIDKLIKFYKLEEINEAFADVHKGITTKAVLRF